MAGNANLEDATLLHTLGFPVIMTGEDKNPGTIVGKNWGQYEWDTEQFTRLFKQHPKAQIGLMLWPLVDVEIDAPPNDDGSFALQAEALLIKLGGDVKTPSWTSRRGKHVLFIVDDEQKLALEAADAPATMHVGNLEVRLGVGGQTQSLIPPSVTDGVARAWIEDLATTTVARMPDALFIEVHTACLQRQAERNKPAPVTETSGLERPGDVFNETATWDDILTPHGWKSLGTQGNVRRWLRPGKTAAGISATTGHCATDTRPDMFYSFSDSPEIAPLEPKKAYSKFEVYTYLNHGADEFAAASAALAAKGFVPNHDSADEFDYITDEDDNEVAAVSAPSIVDKPPEGPPPGGPARRELPDFVFDNPIGQYVLRNDPHTEADRNAVLFQSWELFGNWIGRGVQYRFNNSVIYPNGFLCVVGSTGKGRKGTSLGDAKAPYQVDDAFLKDYVNNRFMNGISSGEGFVSKVGDSPTMVDGRLMIIITEMNRLMTAISRQDSMLSPLLREAYDGSVLEIPTKNNAVKATEALISIILHTTLEEFLENVDPVQITNGLLNRMVFVPSSSTKILTRPTRVNEGDIQRLSNHLLDVQQWSLSGVDGILHMSLSDKAQDLWEEFYVSAQAETGDRMVDAILARSTNHVIKYAMRHAALDKQHVISETHLRSALALWDFAREQSAVMIDRLSPEADDREKLYAAIRDSITGMTRTDMNRVFFPQKKHSQISELLRHLESTKRVGMGTVTKGNQKQEVWKART